MAQATIEIHAEPGEIIEGKTDDRGRIYLGSEYGSQNVKIAVIDADDADSETSS